MSSGKSALTAALVMLSFLIVAAIQSWPLPLHLTTHLTGDPGGDTGVYVWNTWIFSHELLTKRSSPLDTTMILSVGGVADLSLHNYTVFNNLLALPLQHILGVVGAFNVVYLVNFALAGLGMFLLLRRLPHTAHAGPAAAWLGAFLFACSPFLAWRGNGHFSVASAAALPFFALCCVRTLDTRRPLDAFAAGGCLAWAGYSDPYYAVYCILLAAGMGLSRLVDVHRSQDAPRRPRVLWVIDALSLLVLVTVVAIHGFGGGSLAIGAVTVSIRTLYTPILVLSTLVLVRITLTLRPRATWTTTGMRELVRPGLILCTVAAALLAPEIIAVVVRAAEGRMVTAPVPWRSSAPGVDVAALFVPNPNHPLSPAALGDWVRRLPGESVASIPWVVLLTLFGASKWATYRPDRGWLAMAVVFLSLSLGPFVRIAGIETLVPTPWTLARYMPLLGEARMPSRMSVLVVLALSVLFVGAFALLLRRHRGLAVIIGVALAFELLSAPRTLYRADIPAIFNSVRRDPRDARVLIVPTGIKDGLDTVGNFSAAELFYQTAHEKPLVSGYLSRISEPRKKQYTGHPVLGPLISGSSGHQATSAQRDVARRYAPTFISENQIGWVVIDETEASPSLQEFAIDVLRLRLKTRDGAFALYVPDGMEE